VPAPVLDPTVKAVDLLLSKPRAETLTAAMLWRKRGRVSGDSRLVERLSEFRGMRMKHNTQMPGEISHDSVECGHISHYLPALLI
jgi:hypothetical protein